MMKQEILKSLSEMKKMSLSLIQNLTKKCVITDYISLVRTQNFSGKDIKIWTDAFQKAIDENEIIIIPSNDEPYYIDSSLVITSDRHIEAENGAVIKLLEGVDVLLLKNKNTVDTTHSYAFSTPKNTNISVNGGIWEESRSGRAGYGISGKYDKERSFFGVSTCMFFSNVENLTLTNMTFVHTAGFSIQTGNVKNAVFENIRFVECFADGLHINGNCENIFIRNISGQVGDDLVALNMYDWQDSSVSFGPNKNIWCEKLELSQDSKYKAFRIQPGTYFYNDGTKIDCSLTNAVIKNVKGIKTFKMYFQTPSYNYETEQPEKGDTGSADNIYFEDISINLDSPIDSFSEYLDSDSVKGSFAGFEIGSRIGNLFFENIDITLDKAKYPYSYFLCIGPKSVRKNGREFFNPDINSFIDKLEMKNIFINGEKINNIKNNFIREIVFDDIYNDGKSSGKGTIKKIILK